MSRSMVVGLLAAVGAIMAALAGLVHGDLMPAMIACSGTATGLAAYLALPNKKTQRSTATSTTTPETAGPRCPARSRLHLEKKSQPGSIAAR